MIKENELQLVVTKKELGELKTNAEKIRNKVKEILPEYSSKNYSSKNIDKAKEDKALLNKTSKTLNDERIKLEKEFMKPFDDFKNVVKETIDMIKNASSQIDEIVKEVENKEKEAKRKEIINIFEKNIKELENILSFEKIFDDKWLNKTSKITDIEEQIKNRISQIRNDLISIGNLKSKYEVELKNDYLNHFDLGIVINKNTELSKKEELLKSQDEESTKIIENQKEEKMQEMAKTKVHESIMDSIITYTLKITGKTSQLKALRTFLETNEMTFEKLSD